ncbi:MAG: ABC transporter substrate-binding protein [Ktedonobacteraceae bacterium]
MSSTSLSTAFGARARTSMIVTSCLVVLVMLLSACGGGGAATKGSAKSSTLTLTTGPRGDFTNNFSPYAPTATEGTQGITYETLLFFNRMDGSIKPWLASSYKFASDAKSLTFNLRPGVKWTDGQAFTSDDVVFTLNTIKQYPAADAGGIWQYINTVAAPDANTVTITFKKAYTPILWYLGGQVWILPKHLWTDAGDPTKYTNTKPVGTGPFMLKSFSPQLLDYVKNPNYWQPGKPEVAELKYPSYNSNTGAELVLSQGQLDWTGLFTPNIQKTYVNRDPAHNHYWFPARNVVMLYLNTAKAPFNKLAVRQAISSALDREQMYKVAESGYEPVSSPTALVLPANKSFLSPDYANAAFSVDTTKSTQLLESVGFKKGSDGIYADASGKKLSFNINVVNGWTDWVTNCQIMADNLKKIGIDAKVNAVSFNAYYSAMQQGSFDTVISWTNAGPTPYFLYNSMLNSNNTKPVGQTAISNWERWNDPATDALLNQYATSTDQSVQQQAIAGIQKIMVEQVPSIPLVYGATWNEYSTARFIGWPTADNPYAVPAPFDYPDAEIVLLNLHPVA